MRRYFHNKYGELNVLQAYSDSLVIAHKGETKMVDLAGVRIEEDSAPGEPLSDREILEASLELPDGSVIRINAEDTTQEVLIQALPKIRRIKALTKSWIENRPEQGYQSWAHLVQLNSSLSINWETLKVSLEENMISLDYS